MTRVCSLMSMGNKPSISFLNSRCLTSPFSKRSISRSLRTSSGVGIPTSRAWPKKRDLKTFREWFAIELHSVVEDLCDYEIIKDDD